MENRTDDGVSCQYQRDGRLLDGRGFGEADGAFEVGQEDVALGLVSPWNFLIAP